MISIQVLLAFQYLPGIGARAVEKLLPHMYHFEATSPKDLSEFIRSLVLYGLEPKWDTITLDHFTAAFDKMRQAVDFMDEQGIKSIVYGSREYPERLKQLKHPPLALYIRGNCQLNHDGPVVAVVGTREPSDFGERSARRIGQRMAEMGAVVTSGLAIGCDTEAHRGCLDAGGITIALMAHGLDTIYPAANRGLAAEIIENGGALVSEYPIGVSATRYSFVERDRLQSGLSDAVIVVETGVDGGTMHTAKFCREQNRILAVVVHPEHAQLESNAGNLALLENPTAMPIKARGDLEALYARIAGTEASTRAEKPRYRLAIFDLDQTVVDSEHVKSLRSQRAWKQITPLVGSIRPYDGIVQLMEELRNAGTTVAIVTTSVSNYCNDILRAHAIPHDFAICYHDVKKPKPDPEAYLKALQRSGIELSEACAIGDRAIDIEAAARSNMDSIAVLWGTTEHDLLNSAQPTHTCTTVDELRRILFGESSQT